MPDMPEWLDADEATRWLRFPSRRALYQAVRRGHVPASRLGRHLRFHRPTITKLLLARSTVSTSATLSR